MSIFNINNSKKPNNKVKIKYQEDIVSPYLDSIKNETQYSSHQSIKFNNFFGAVIGNITDKTYYPIFSIGSTPDSGNFYRLSGFLYKYISDFFNGASQELVGPGPNLDFSAITTHIENCKIQDAQAVADAIANINDDTIANLFFKTIFDADLDPELAEILSYETWNSPEPT